MSAPDWERARAHAFGRLASELPPHLYYHGIHHTRDEVLPAAERLALLSGLGAEEALLLRTAVAYHDIGFIEQYTQNEPIAARIAGEALPQFGYSPEQVDIIQEMILATQIIHTPQNFLEELIRDADLDSLGRENFFETSHNLWLEWHSRGNQYTLKEWYNIQLRFLSEHVYHTLVAKGLRDASKRQNIEELKIRLAEME